MIINHRTLRVRTMQKAVSKFYSDQWHLEITKAFNKGDLDLTNCQIISHSKHNSTKNITNAFINN